MQVMDFACDRGMLRLLLGQTGVWAMKLYRVNKLARAGGVVIKKKHILAQSDRDAVRQAEDSDDCPVCEVLRDGTTVGEIR